MLSALREFSGISDLLRYVRKRWRSFYDRNRCTYYPAGLRQPVADPDPRHDAVPKIARDRLLLRQSAQPVLDCAVQTSRSALSRFHCRKTAASAGTPHRSVGRAAKLLHRRRFRRQHPGSCPERFFRHLFRSGYSGCLYNWYKSISALPKVMLSQHGDGRPAAPLHQSGQLPSLHRTAC